MRLICTIIISLLSIFQGSPVFPQLYQTGDLKELFTPPHPETGFTTAKDNRNEIELFLSGLFLVYKNFISSQDGSHCTFSPSCSEYCVQSVKKNGLLIGLADSFDRLTRCNGMSPEKYIRNPETGLFDDVPEIFNRYIYKTDIQ
ncbi:MAG: membrane protein insertion efficiency factor YidD [Bacteroidetes bacterium]|nr:membrane protein insertion efficiency factor YidD [Bacteroidota bacterium]